eukprot:gene43334-57672_t
MKDSSGGTLFEKSIFSAPFACLPISPSQVQNNTLTPPLTPPRSKKIQGPDTESSPIMTCVSSGGGAIDRDRDHDEIFEKSNHSKYEEVIDESFSLPMHEACSSGDLEQVKTLVESGAGVNAQNPAGASTSLHLACVSGDLALVQYLVDKGAKLDLQNVGGMTPLHIACD